MSSWKRRPISGRSPPESASRVGHPAPFPVELPERLIHLYTYRGDLVLDPFMGSGTTAVAALRLDRHFAGYDTDPQYVEAARRRIDAERARQPTDVSHVSRRVVLSGEAEAWRATRTSRLERFVRVSRRENSPAARWSSAHSPTIRSNVKLPEGVDVDFAARDLAGGQWFFDVAGGFTSSRPGLRRTDTLWKALGKAAVLSTAHPSARFVVLTTDGLTPKSAGHGALSVLLGPARPIHDVIVLSSTDDLERLRQHGRGRQDRPTDAQRGMLAAPSPEVLR